MGIPHAAGVMGIIHAAGVMAVTPETDQAARHRGRGQVARQAARRPHDRLQG